MLVQKKWSYTQLTVLQHYLSLCGMCVKAVVVIKKLTLIFVSCCQQKFFLHRVVFIYIYHLSYFLTQLHVDPQKRLQAFQTVSLAMSNKASTEKQQRNYFRFGWHESLDWRSYRSFLKPGVVPFSNQYALCTVFKNWRLLVMLIFVLICLKSPFFSFGGKKCILR